MIRFLRFEAVPLSIGLILALPLSSPGHPIQTIVGRHGHTLAAAGTGSARRVRHIDRTVPNSTDSGDPSVGIDANNKVYLGYINADGGRTWRSQRITETAFLKVFSTTSSQYGNRRVGMVFPHFELSK
jgi:hypothetical protein